MKHRRLRWQSLHIQLTTRITRVDIQGVPITIACLYITNISVANSFAGIWNCLKYILPVWLVVRRRWRCLIGLCSHVITGTPRPALPFGEWKANMGKRTYGLTFSPGFMQWWQLSCGKSRSKMICVFRMEENWVTHLNSDVTMIDVNIKSIS